MVGEENPWAEIDPYYSEDSDRIFMIKSDHFFLGHIAVFEIATAADCWANAMRDGSNVWSCWDMGRPVGPFGDDQQYKRGRHGSLQTEIIEVKGSNQRKAAELALEIFKKMRV